MKNRLVVVSNRVKGDAGGLSVGLSASLQQTGGLWFGWSGEIVPDGTEPEVSLSRHGAVTYGLLDLTQTDIDEYYSGYANGALWPLFHNRIDLASFAHKNWLGYLRVNRSFATRLKPLLQPDDIIWVHDYHLIPLALELRALGVTNPIGFFLHIPWPPADILFALPSAKEILRGLMSYDLVGFQTDGDLENFASCLARQGMGHRVDGRIVDPHGRSVRVGAFPIGIDTATFAALASRAARHPVVQRTMESLGGRRLIIGVDRLDYSKGLIQRVEAFGHYLETDTASRGSVIFLQVTPKSRSEVNGYPEMQRKLAELAGRINGSLGDVDWVPMRYINRSLSRPALAGLYRAARVGLVTPLRDGMNLVAKEYVASQDPSDPGVLVLSRFAGAAQELDGALLVNPYDREETATAIGRALQMPLAERLHRWRGMFARILRHDVHHWRESFLSELESETSDFLASTA